MPIDTQEFYHPLPQFGVFLSDQWNEFRTDFDALAPIVRAAFVDIAAQSGSHDLAGLAMGELDFRNRYRVFYDKAAEEWKIQYNSGTEATPVWIDYVRIRNVDGRFIVEAPGGLESANGFYNTDFLTVDTHPEGGFRKSNVDTLKVNSLDGFYWSVDSLSNPILNLTQQFGVSKSEDFESSAEWTFTHNIGQTPLMSQTFDTNGCTITPNRTCVNDPNVASFYFTPDKAGTALVASGGSGAVTVSTITNPFYVVARESVGKKFVFDSGNAGIVFNRDDFYLTPVSDTKEVMVNALASGSAAGGEANTASNLAGDEGVFSSKSGVDLRFKSLTAGSNITLSSDANAITIAGPAGAGEANTASNLAGDEGIFSAKSGVDLEFKSLTAGDNVTLSSDGNAITINSATGGGFYLTVGETGGGPTFTGINKINFNDDSFYVTQNAPNTDEVIVNFSGTAGAGGNGETNTASNLAGDEGVFASKSGVDLQFKSLTAGSNVTLSSDGNAITINSADSGFYLTVGETGGGPTFTGINKINFNDDSFYVTQNAPNTDEVIVNFNGTAGGGGGEANTASNLAGDEGIFASKSGVDLQFKSLTAGTNVTMSSDGNAITINAAAGSVTFKETESGGYSTTASTVAFDSNDFYLSSGGDGNPIVALIPAATSAVAGASEVFGSAVEWQFTHNLNSNAVVWSAYDDGREAVIPSTVDVSDPNTTYFYFAVATAGLAVVIG
jgi:hypothetical protein